MSEEQSAILSLPYILPAQAQKHVTHNEALRLLDVLVQLVVTSRQVAEPPSAPTQGARYIVPSDASGAFSDHAGAIAVWLDGQWHFVPALSGWQAEVLDEAIRVVFDGTGWVGPEARAQQVERLGVSMQADATNGLAVAATASLLTHAGAGHQLKINKAAATDTASLLFQTGWSGRAEMGTAGSDAFEIKTSADGSTFHTALRALQGSGRVELPEGSATALGSAVAPGMAFLGDPDTGLFSPAPDTIALSVGGQSCAVLTLGALALDVPVTGQAVTQSATDMTAGRLTKVGDAGILGTLAVSSGSEDLRGRALTGGLWGYTTNAVPQHPEGGAAWVHGMLAMRAPNALTGAGDRGVYLTGRVTGSAANLRLWWGADSSVAGEINWAEIITNRRLTGTVSQSDGVPTGAVIERGNNANGAFVRYADGTLICWNPVFGDVTPNIADGALFRSDSVVWTFPAAFVDANVALSGAARVDTRWISFGTNSTISANLRAYAATSQLSAGSLRVTAIGRWF